MQAAALLAVNPSPTDEEIVAHMNGNLCRCATLLAVSSAPSSAPRQLMKEGANHAKTNIQGITRREFLVRSTVIAGSGFLSIGLPGFDRQPGRRSGRVHASLYPAIWFTITPDGITTMHIVKTEMGQHIGTGLAQVIADELEVKWKTCGSTRRWRAWRTSRYTAWLIPSTAAA